ncbi:MAG: type I-E CRISPR-associated protein Cse1/CasA [Deltaproteobacteria bacterium]|nr:type I-E CRISPR-associated protein Cse1/CasA [Deltaproteobacteria bacterium]
MIEQFNVLRDPWIALWRDDKRVLVTLEELLAGDAESSREIAHSRDELRAFSHVLLSALLQALFAPGSLESLRERIGVPMDRAAIRAAIDAVADDFELLGEPGWMQHGPRLDADRTDALFHEFSDTYRPHLARGVSLTGGVCPACAVVGLYGFMAFAPAGGSGYSPSVRGTPPLSTLVRAGSVRATAWANVLVLRGASETYGPESSRPWAIAPETLEPDGSTKQYRRDAHAIGLVEGLFWKPRAVRLAPADDGECPLCGGHGARVIACGFTKGAKKEDGFFEHPLTPSVVIKNERRTQHIATDKPVWTGLADMLPAVRAGSAKASDPQAAPTVRQWRVLTPVPLELFVFAYRFDNASMEGRFFESYPALKKSGDSDFARAIETMVARAEDTVSALASALKRAFSDNPKSKGAYWPEEARQQFWRRAETPFWSAVALLDAEEEPPLWGPAMARLARSLFDTMTSLTDAQFDGRRHIEAARKKLNVELKILGKADPQAPTDSRTNAGGT